MSESIPPVVDMLTKIYSELRAVPLKIQNPDQPMREVIQGELTLPNTLRNRHTMAAAARLLVDEKIVAKAPNPVEQRAVLNVNHPNSITLAQGIKMIPTGGNVTLSMTVHGRPLAEVSDQIISTITKAELKAATIVREDGVTSR